MAWAASNWVQKRKQAEEHLKSKSESLWHDIKAAIEDASRSFNELYGKDLNQDSSVVLTNDHRIRVSSGPQERIVDIDFNRENLTITANYHGGSTQKIYRMTSDSDSAFIIDDKNERATADDVSRGMLEPILFPVGSIYSKRGLLTP